MAGGACLLYTSLFTDTDSKYYTFEEYKTLIKDNQTDKDGNLIYLYANNKDELIEVKEKYGDERRSEIVYSSEEFNQMCIRDRSLSVWLSLINVLYSSKV